MNNVLSRKPPGSFWAISILALLWNGIGCFQYFALTTATDEQLATMFSAAERTIFQSTPAWVTGAFAIAVFGGLIGALALLARKGWARILFILSLIAVIVQHSWTFVFSGYLDIMPATAAIGPVLVVIVGIFEIWYAGNASRRGWLR
ncbi:MAG: hypothetical protein ACSHW2_03145 [Parasphingopyxis sp.]